jgi:hypothetical protein
MRWTLHCGKADSFCIDAIAFSKRIFCQPAAVGFVISLYKQFQNKKPCSFNYCVYERLSGGNEDEDSKVPYYLNAKHSY